MHGEGELQTHVGVEGRIAAALPHVIDGHADDARLGHAEQRLHGAALVVAPASLAAQRDAEAAGPAAIVDPAVGTAPVGTDPAHALQAQYHRAVPPRAKRRPGAVPAALAGRAEETADLFQPLRRDAALALRAEGKHGAGGGGGG